METDPEAIRLPFFHRNVDYDEVIFYHRGEFMSRAGIGEGMITFHPTGLHHGPQPAARARDAEAAASVSAATPRFADEVAVMIDARHALHPTALAPTVEVEGYVDSWRMPGS
jgi:homogentisate 1,2-dioxygenase